MEYYDNIEDDYLLSKIDLAKKVKKFLLFIAILFLVYFFYQSYTTYQALNLIKDQQIIYEKQGTIEETKKSKEEFIMKKSQFYFLAFYLC